MGYKYTDDDYCDIYENKICDNCGKCLELEGIDTKAIRIEDIAKTQEENSVLEEEFLEDLKASLDEAELEEIEEENMDLDEIYKKFGSSLNNSDDFNGGLEEDIDEEYEDAFDHMEYIDEIAALNDIDFEEMTEEVYPGVRRFIKKEI
ncbi:hypothetical protein [Clostridium sp. SM-530-WT-3G]|uniref:hypothetical protein n=1 Tax=Clostridium sp. SM-530-WT-3G TaxID=2725303 RepID=UPI00145E8493|nr:hypothetical protein [Clostridium sp. SM-530-WT-3G]NME81655.1 hypothetical protein [Clostridium sp. SM-530-WT-3G]